MTQSELATLVSFSVRVEVSLLGENDCEALPQGDSLGLVLLWQREDTNGRVLGRDWPEEKLSIAGDTVRFLSLSVDTSKLAPGELFAELYP